MTLFDKMIVSIIDSCELLESKGGGKLQYLIIFIITYLYLFRGFRERFISVYLIESLA